MSESFGARLRRQREQQHIALATITEQTKIKQSLLEALERDDVSQWPSGIFRRAYIRAYAHAIGLDPNVVVREFLELYPDPDEVVTTDGVDHDPSARPPTRFRYMVRSAVGSLSAHWAGNEPKTSPGGPDSTPARTPAVKEQVQRELDLAAAADLCTAFASAAHADDVAALLREAAGILDAIGLIVWSWDPMAMKLKPAMAYGYSDRVLAQLPALERDADNATAASFRDARPCTVDGQDRTNGALVLPLLTAGGCRGVLAIELQNGGEQLRSVRAIATIFASQLARWVEPAVDRSRRAATPA